MASKAARAASLSFLVMVFPLEPVELEDTEELREAGELVIELPEPAEAVGEAFLASFFEALSLAHDSSCVIARVLTDPFPELADDETHVEAVWISSPGVVGNVDVEPLCSRLSRCALGSEQWGSKPA